MIAAIGGLLAKLGLSWLGNLILDWDRNRQQSAQDTAEEAGANKQVIRDTAGTSASEGRIAQAEAQADKTQAGIVEAAQKGEF